MTWYLQSMSDHDTHCGTLSRGTVQAKCGIRFAPSELQFGCVALPGDPPDPDQVCPRCYLASTHTPAGA